MATEPTKRKKGKKKPSSSKDPVVAESLPELTIPQAPATPPSVPPKIQKKAPTVTPKVSVRPIEDPKSKTEVTGTVSINFTYGPLPVRLLKGKKTRIPTVAVPHCKRLKYI